MGTIDLLDESKTEVISFVKSQKSVVLYKLFSYLCIYKRNQQMTEEITTEPFAIDEDEGCIIACEPSSVRDLIGS